MANATAKEGTNMTWDEQYALEVQMVLSFYMGTLGYSEEEAIFAINNLDWGN